MDYLIIIESTDDGFSAYVPDLPGCISIGDTVGQVKENIQEAIVFHLEGMREDGLEIPAPTTKSAVLHIPDVA